MQSENRTTTDAPTVSISGNGKWYSGLFVLALVGTLLLFGFLLRESRIQAAAKATTDGANLARVLERQLNTSLRRLDADLQAMAGRIRPQEMDPQAAQLYRSEWATYLNALKINFVEVKEFYVVDATGDVLYSSGAFQQINVAERSNFKQLSAAPSPSMVWSDVVLSKGDGLPTIAFARGVRDGAGKFLGIVTVLVDVDYFQKVIAEIDIGAQGLISVRDVIEYKLLLRHPQLPAELNKASKSFIFDRILKGERQGFALFTSPLDGLTRYTTFLVLKNFPFVVTVALNEVDVLAQWRSQVLTSSVIAAVLMLLVGLVLLRLWRAERARQQTMLQLLEARDSAEEASRSKGQFLANMSHEIRTPMNAIMGMLNLLQSTALTKRQRDYASKTEGAAQSLLGLLSDILDFSKVEAGKMTLESEPFHIDKVMRNLSVVLSANVGTKDIEVLFDVDPDLPSVVRGDAMRLQQVLINLGGNAVKFTSEGQVVLSLRKLAQTDHTATIRFAVQDTGIGIAPEHLGHIFSGFSQAEGSTTRRFGGTGLGLAISKRFVELMGGNIQITSEHGVGSTFAFTLELPTVDLSTEPQAATLPQRVLVVDDNPIASELTLCMVRSWGWSAELATSGKEAVERISDLCATATLEFPYPVIYMDWKMPDMDGWEATRQIRELADRKKLPQPNVIMFTAHGREMLSHRTEAEQEQINGFLVKPATSSMLYDAWMDAQSGNAGIRKLTKGRSSTRQLTGMRILVVEDNLINQQVAEELLSAEGAIVSLAANGQLGVDAVAAAAPQFDVVLMDVQMPVLDGYGATRAIREELQLKDLPIIAMTANAMASDREACLAAGMNEHIGKPFDMAKLVSLLIRMTGFHAQVAQPDRPDASSPSPSASPAHNLPVPEVEGLDIRTALNRMSGMRSLYVRTAKDFVKIMDTAVPELQQCLVTGDKQQAMMRLHTLKGNAGTLGATEMAAQAATLEKLYKTSAGMAECEAALPQFEVLVRDTQGRMREAIALLGTDDTNKKPAKAATPFTGVVSDAARQALHNIAALAKAADLEVLQNFAEVRGLLGEFPVESMDALEEALQNLDLETASTICDQMLLSLNG